MNKIYLALAIHNHQPVGNFDWIFESAAHLAYEPMLAALERHPGVRLALHYSGPLRDWLAEHRPHFLKRVRALIKRGQVEMLTGGYYEPVLVALPNADKVGQIRKMTATIKKDLDFRASGAWLAERVWEPHLPKPLAEAGVQYTILDDTHFKYLGFSDQDLLGYYLTEEQGDVLKVFGSSKYLRFAMPWEPVEAVIDWLRSHADESGARVAVMGDDGEKFGLWPGSHEHCWEHCWDDECGWVEKFFTALEANADWLTTIAPGEYAAAYPALGRAYLPSAAYEEMAEWSLPTEQSADFTALKHRLQDEGRWDVLRFLQGGAWRNFMAKYPEINAMHKKMLYVSDKVHRIKSRDVRSTAQDALWAGQCNCPYWHGLFGGIYLIHIRETTYEKLITAEVLADRATHGDGAWVEAAVTDINKDGHDEVILSSDAQSLTVEPACGGALVEWDWRAIQLNLVNTLARRPEGYHRLLRQAAERGEVATLGQLQAQAGAHTDLRSARLVRVKEMGLEQKLFYDWHRRISLLDHVMPDSVTLDDFYRGGYTEWGDFVNQPYKASVNRVEAAGETDDGSPAPQAFRLSLAREGGVWQDQARCPLRIEKAITLAAGELTLEVVYRLTNLGDGPITGRFGVETNWGLSGGDGPQAYSVWPGGNLVRLSDLHAVDSAAEVALVNEWFGRVVVASDRQAGWWQFPVETISNSEAGFERVYQGTCLLTYWPLELGEGQTWQTVLRFKLT